MAACDLNINLTQPAADVVRKLKAKVIAQGGTFTGNEISGNIHVPIMGSHVSGTYTIAGQQMNMLIDHKPFFLSCSQIEGVLTAGL